MKFVAGAGARRRRRRRRARRPSSRSAVVVRRGGLGGGGGAGGGGAGHAAPDAAGGEGGEGGARAHAAGRAVEQQKGAQLARRTLGEAARRVRRRRLDRRRAKAMAPGKTSASAACASVTSARAHRDAGRRGEFRRVTARGSKRRAQGAQRDDPRADGRRTGGVGSRHSVRWREHFHRPAKALIASRSRIR